MDDIVSQLSSFIESKEGMDTVKELASSLMSGDSDISSMLGSMMSGGAAKSLLEDVQKPPQTTPDLPLSPDQLATVMRIFSALNSSVDDSRMRLLQALKPNLSEKRRERVDRAIKLMKLISIMPMITDSGLLKL
jgi:hypothetical protein